ncbi:Zinc finger protein [Plakobranchus ocellatus]|uniref:Zinc finger protein n=1 Tax=Plakobranchus ocellatus TaxID=259542 RepID=A0AAV3ZJM8_9GAST|nr:Zinc finger protein [Plakobranchus ocellatus]
MDHLDEFLKMLFEIKSSGATLTTAVKMLLRGVSYVMDYVDGLMVHFPTWEDHLRTLKELFRRLQWANFTVRPTKYMLGARTMTSLITGLEREQSAFRKRT